MCVCVVPCDIQGSRCSYNIRADKASKSHNIILNQMKGQNNQKQIPAGGYEGQCKLPTDRNAEFPVGC